MMPLEHGILEAAQGVKIAYLTREQIVQLLRRIMVIIGINGRNIPEGESATFLADAAPLVIGKWTAADVENAFLMAVKGDIDVDLNLYDKPFSLMYIGSVMKKYEPVYNETLTRHHRRNALEQPKQRPSDDEQHRLMVQMCLRSYERHCKGESTWADYNSAVYDFLQRQGVVSFSPDRIARAEVEAVAAVKAEMIQGGGLDRQLREALASLGTGSIAVESKAKEMLLRELFNDLHRGGNELKNLI